MKLYAAAAPYVILEHEVWARKAVKYDGGGTKSCGVEKRREHLIGLSKQSTINGLTFEEIGLSQDCKEKHGGIRTHRITLMPERQLRLC